MPGTAPPSGARLGLLLRGRHGLVVVAAALVAVLAAAVVALVVGGDRADRSTADGGQPTDDLGTPSASPGPSPADPARALLEWAERD